MAAEIKNAQSPAQTCEYLPSNAICVYKHDYDVRDSNDMNNPHYSNRRHTKFIRPYKINDMKCITSDASRATKMCRPLVRALMKYYEFGIVPSNHVIITGQTAGFPFNPLNNQQFQQLISRISEITGAQVIIWIDVGNLDEIQTQLPSYRMADHIRIFNASIAKYFRGYDPIEDLFDAEILGIYTLPRVAMQIQAESADGKLPLHSANELQDQITNSYDAFLEARRAPNLAATMHHFRQFTYYAALLAKHEADVKMTMVTQQSGSPLPQSADVKMATATQLFGSHLPQAADVKIVNVAACQQQLSCADPVLVASAVQRAVAGRKTPGCKVAYPPKLVYLRAEQLIRAAEKNKNLLEPFFWTESLLSFCIAYEIGLVASRRTDVDLFSSLSGTGLILYGGPLRSRLYEALNLHKSI